MKLSILCSCNPYNHVVPRVGTWVEMSRELAGVVSPMVVPRVGTWVEMGIEWDKVNTVRRPPRGDVG